MTAEVSEMTAGKRFIYFFPHFFWQEIRGGTLGELAQCDMGAPLHTLVLAGELHPEELKWYMHYHKK